MEFSKENAYALITCCCLSYRGTSPFTLAEVIMNKENMRIHGPEHHYLTGAVLMTCYKNATGKSINAEDLEQIMIRADKIPPGVCGYYGVCGDTMAAGAFLSIVKGTTYLSGESWGNANKLSAYCQREVSRCPGPRCCKRTTFSVLKAASDYLAEYEAVKLNIPENFYCTYSKDNESCLGSECVLHKSHITRKSSLKQESDKTA